MKINKPVFVIGCPRSGTTMFFNLFCFHPEVAWFSSYTNILPFLPSLALFNRMYNFSSFTRLQKHKISPIPAEAYKIWKKCCSENFLNSPLNENDVTNEAILSLNRIIKKHLKYHGKNRFITKITGPPKIRYLNRIFPDALFIYIIRDGRAVVNSLLNVGFWKNGKGLLEPWWKDLPKEFRNEWISSGKSPLILASVQWKYMIQLYLREREFIEKSRYLKIKYEEIVENPFEIMHKALNFCNLEHDKRFYNKIKSYSIQNMNYKWNQNFSYNEKKLLNCSLRNYLKIFKYE